MHAQPCYGYGGVYLPTEQVEFANGPATFHASSICEDDDFPCPVHKPSQHLMRHWPMVLSGEGFGEPVVELLVSRLCPHGFAHPDPDSLRRLQIRPTHLCDDCCLGPSLSEVVAELVLIERNMR